MVGRKLTVWLIISVYISGAQADIKRSGPFKIEVEKFTKCEDEGTGTVVLGTRITRTSDGRHIYNNTMYYGHPLNKDFKIYFELQSFGNGGYKPRFLRHTFKGCEDIWRYFQDLYKRMELGGKKVESCPIPARNAIFFIDQEEVLVYLHRYIENVFIGNYSISVDLNQDFITNFKSMIYNKYKGVGEFYYKGMKVGCLNVYGEIVPKE